MFLLQHINCGLDVLDRALCLTAGFCTRIAYNKSSVLLRSNLDTVQTFDSNVAICIRMNTVYCFYDIIRYGSGTCYTAYIIRIQRQIYLIVRYCALDTFLYYQLHLSGEILAICYNSLQMISGNEVHTHGVKQSRRGRKGVCAFRILRGKPSTQRSCYFIHPRVVLQDFRCKIYRCNRFSSTFYSSCRSKVFRYSGTLSKSDFIISKKYTKTRAVVLYCRNINRFP